MELNRPSTLLRTVGKRRVTVGGGYGTRMSLSAICREGPGRAVSIRWRTFAESMFR